MKPSNGNRGKLRRARSKFSAASPEDIDYRTVHGLDRTLTARLLTCELIRERQNLILVAPAGLGKSWRGCTFAVQACRQDLSACRSSTKSWPSRTAAAATHAGSCNSPRRTSYSSTTPRDAICSKSSMTGTATVPRWRPANCYGFSFVKSVTR
ncbi:ATP-binding protein [Paraburkholderia caffeinilytica]|uniref:ATP-binding protein n=1 Tax=Paraburkholderia caffeinilytica TaxID=1761016 RepID=UPI003DA05128